MKLNLKKINYHKWIPSRFSSFQAKLLIAFLVATLLPLTLVALVSYHVSYNLARDRITNSALMSDEQLIFQLNSRLNQTENVADTIQYQMYAFEHSSPDQVGTMQALTSMRSNISLYKSTFDFFHIYVFLKPEQTGADEGIYFFSTDKLFNYGISESELHSIGSSSLWLLKKNTTLPRVISASKRSANTLLCFRALQDKSSNVLEYAYCIALDCDEFSRYLQTSASDTAISSYILTPQGQIAAHSDSSRNQTWISDSIKQMFLENTNSFFKDNDIYYNCRTLDNGWLHITEIPENYIKSNTQVLIKTLLITVIISLPLTIFIVILFSRKLTSRIAALSYAMESFHLGHDPEHLSIITLPHPADASNYDEIDNLGITFEDMQHTIAQNLKSIVSLSINEERLKYQLLQSQINPHFLYNILGTIRTCQALGKLDIADQMLTNLTAFYRLTLRKSKELIPIKDELEIARLYLEMEKLVHDPVHLRLYLINKFLIQRHRSFHCKIIAAAYRIMDHYTVYIFLPCHIINCFQKNQTCTSAISFVSDRIFGCHKFNLTVCLEMLMQFSQPAIYDHQHYRCIRTSFVFLYNLTVRNLLRILFCYSLYRNVIHFLSHKSCLHFCYTDK